MSWLDKILPSRIQTSDKKQIPDDIWSQCDACEATIYSAELVANLRVCPKCNHHMRIGARTRLEALFDKDSMSEIAADIKPVDKLKFKDSKSYKDRIKAAQRSTDENDALIAFSGKLKNKPLVAAAFEFSYMGGSMGSVVGEKFVRAVEEAIALNAPFVCFAASGGARMQEGLISLMQMSKTSAALTRLSAKKLPFISVLTDPTMGGVSASFAMLGDLILAEPKALVGFAGPRVIEQTVRETLPEGFQRSEFLLEKGAIDMIVTRQAMRKTLASIFSNLMHDDSATSESAEAKAEAPSIDLTQAIGFGVAGNFAGHLEQAGEAADFANVKTEEATQPKAIFPFYVPSDKLPEEQAFLATYPLSHERLNFPQLSDADNLQIEPEVALICEVAYDDKQQVKALTPTHFAAYNDCSIRRPNANKICEKKNWGENSKGLSNQWIALDNFEQGGLLDSYRIASFHQRGDTQSEYGADSAAVGYSYFHQKLLDWVIERMNNQPDEGPMNHIAPLLEQAGYPDKAVISIGATRYTEFGESNFLQVGDTSVVVVYNGKHYSHDDIAAMAQKGEFADDVSALVQSVC